MNYVMPSHNEERDTKMDFKGITLYWSKCRY